MKTIGLIGGTTWHSTIEYYRIINENVMKRLSGLHSAHCIIYSVDYYEFIFQNLKNWKKISESFNKIAKKLEISGILE